MKAKSYLKLYVIRQKSTGNMMPEIYQKKGYTHSEPENPHTSIPRLFVTRSRATRALNYWLIGKQSAFLAGDEVIHKIVTVPDRNPEDMEITSVQLELP